MSAIRQIQPSQPTIRIQMDQAFRECLDIVLEGLKSRGEQWTPDAKQDMVSTLFLAAAKMNCLDMWEAPKPVLVKGPGSPPADFRVPEASDKPENPPQVSRQAPLGPPEAASDDRRQPWTGYRGMLDAFAGMKDQMPWPTFYAILKDFQVREPGEFPNQNIAQGCYAVLKQAREHYRSRAADPTSFDNFEAGEGGPF